MRCLAESATLGADFKLKMTEQIMSQDEQFEQGLQMRKQVMGEAFRPMGKVTSKHTEGSITTSVSSVLTYRTLG